MQTKIQEWIYAREAFAGVECVQKEGKVCYHLCILKKEKNAAKIVLQKQNIASIEELKEHLEEDMPIFLVLNVKGVLNKMLESIPNSEEEALLAVFPAAQLSDFYVQQLESRGKALVSVFRKDRVAAFLDDFLAAKLWVVNVFIGPFWVAELLPILPAYTAKIQTAQQLLYLEQQHISRFENQIAAFTEWFTIGDERVQEEMLLALSMTFLALTQPNIQGLALEQTQTQQSNFYYKKLFHYTALGALGFFFLALLGNYLLFDHYNAAQQNLKVELLQQQSLLQQRDSLAQKYNQKKALLGDQLTLGRSKASYYADQLAATLPSSLQFTELALFPKIETKEYGSEDKLPQYNRSKIKIKGRCQASVFYNNWKYSLKELPWVASIHNLSYQNEKNGQGIFELEITLKDD